MKINNYIRFLLNRKRWGEYETEAEFWHNTQNHKEPECPF